MDGMLPDTPHCAMPSRSYATILASPGSSYDQGTWIPSLPSFELFDHDGPVGIELHCSRRSPSKLTISFNLSEPIFS